MEIHGNFEGLCFYLFLQTYDFLDMLGIWVVPPCWHTPYWEMYWGIRQFYVAIEKEAFDGH